MRVENLFTNSEQRFREDWVPKLESRLLRTRVWLHLYRLTEDQLGDSKLVAEEVRRLSLRFANPDPELHSGFNSKLGVQRDLAQSKIAQIDSDTARLLHHYYHYLASPRPDGIHLGLFQPATTGETPTLVCLLTFSEFDLLHIRNALPFELEPREMLVLSRQITLENAPPNTVTHALSEACAWLRQNRPEVKMLLTYVDPNLGFQGTAYKAANWRLIGRERKDRYLYLDGNFTTVRQFVQEFGTADFSKLSALLGPRIMSSVWKLEPLKIFAYFLNPKLRKKIFDSPCLQISPPETLVGR